MPRHSRCGTLKNPHFSVAISAEHRSKYEPFTGNGDVSISVKNKKPPTKKQISGFNSIFVVLQKFQFYIANELTIDITSCWINFKQLTICIPVLYFFSTLPLNVSRESWMQTKHTDCYTFSASDLYWPKLPQGYIYTCNQICVG